MVEKLNEHITFHITFTGSGSEHDFLCEMPANRDLNLMTVNGVIIYEKGVMISRGLALLGLPDTEDVKDKLHEAIADGAARYSYAFREVAAVEPN